MVRNGLTTRAKIKACEKKCISSGAAQQRMQTCRIPPERAPLIQRMGYLPVDAGTPPLQMLEKEVDGLHEAIQGPTDNEGKPTLKHVSMLRLPEYVTNAILPELKKQSQSLGLLPPV